MVFPVPVAQYSELFFKWASDLLFVATPEGHIVKANAAFHSTMNPAAADSAKIQLSEVFLRPSWQVLVSHAGEALQERSFQLKTLEGTRIERVGWVTGSDSQQELLLGMFRSPTGDPTEVVLVGDQPIAYDRRLQEVLELAEQESKRIAHVIHDGFVQHAVGAQMWVESIQGELTAEQSTAREAIDTVTASISAAIDEARQVINRLQPVIAESNQLHLGVAYLIGDFQKQTPAKISVTGTVKPLPAPLVAAAVRILQESIRNAIQHSQASSIAVQLDGQPDQLHLSVRDDGVGFDPQQVSANEGGLRGIRQRAKIFAGRVAIDSVPGAGTTVHVYLPLEPSVPHCIPSGENEL